MVKIYTRTGDKATTQISFSENKRVRKDSLICDVIGHLDELNSHVGMLVYYCQQSTALQPDIPLFIKIQQQLFQLGFTLTATQEITEDIVVFLEEAIDHWHAQLPTQTAFILPGGTQIAAQSHICRTITRRCERVWIQYHQEQITLIHQYLNRLSDLFYIFARFANQQLKSPEQSI